MKIAEVKESIIGRRVSCVENGSRVTGVIIGISEDEYNVNVRIRFDEPLQCWSGDYNVERWVEEEYNSWARKCDGWGNLSLTYFIDTLDWLKDYKPKDAHFTDEFEMKEISDNLCLKKMNREQLCDIRNQVVMFYDKLMDETGADREKVWNLNTSMMSVTSVIDQYKWRAGAEI